MKRDSTDISFPDFDDHGESSQHPHSPKRTPPPDNVIKFWVDDLPPEGLGHGCASAAFEVISSGVIDDLKSAITVRLSHRRFALYKRQIRLTQNGQHKEYFEKLATLSSDAPLKFQWSEYSTPTHKPPLEYRP